MKRSGVQSSIFTEFEKPQLSVLTGSIELLNYLWFCTVVVASQVKLDDYQHSTCL